MYFSKACWEVIFGWVTDNKKIKRAVWKWVVRTALHVKEYHNAEDHGDTVYFCWWKRFDQKKLSQSVQKLSFTATLFRHRILEPSSWVVTRWWTQLLLLSMPTFCRNTQCLLYCSSQKDIFYQEKKSNTILWWTVLDKFELVLHFNKT